MIKQGDYNVTIDWRQLQIGLATDFTPGQMVLTRIPQHPGFVNYATLAQKAKFFDDRLVAAMDRRAWQVKGPWLLQLASQVATRVPVVAACSSLYGRDDWRSPQSEAVLQTFLQDEKLSKPLGFYAGTSDLEGVFQRDRLLQTALTQAEIEVLQAALKADPDYGRLLEMQSNLTGPPAPDLSHLLAKGEKSALFPPSRSPEAGLAKKLLGTDSIPEGFQLVTELIAAVQSDRLSLKPAPDAGFYEHQLWALEPLLRPLEPRLKAWESYQEYLVDLFKGLFCMTRETHIKQLPETQLGCGIFDRPLRVTIPAPALSVEPLGGSYRRRAESYQFLQKALGDWLGELESEVDQMCGLFHGAYLTVCRELEVADEPLDKRCPDADRETFQRFQEQRMNDPDLQQESRHMVPLYYDQERRLHKVMLFLGWYEQPLGLVYQADDWNAAVSVVHSQTGEACALWEPDLEFQEATLLKPITAEVLSNRLLNRQEFCDLCWSYPTFPEMVKALRTL